MKKIITYSVSLFLILGTISLNAGSQPLEKTKQRQLAEKIRKTLPDSIFKKVRPGNLLDEGVYNQLAKEGWKTKEIFTIVDEFTVRHKKAVKNTESYVAYNKEWKPYWYMLTPNDTITRNVDPVYQASVNKAYMRAFKEASDEYYPRLFYTPNDRMNGIRNTGYFRHNILMPGVARTLWIQANPLNSDKLMVILDGDGIWRTDNNGRNWDPITDRIPNRLHRAQAAGFCIPVDPDDWNHVIALMKGVNYPVYESMDGGQTWTAVSGSTSVPASSDKGFKRGYGFKDASGKFKIIGSLRDVYTGWAGVLYISEDKGVTWRIVNIPSSLMEWNVKDNTFGVWLQEIAFDPSNRNIIYVPTSRQILRNTDGFTYTNGTYKLERMRFKVYNRDKTVLRSDTTEFPFPISDGPMMLNIDPKNANRMWASVGSQAKYQSAAYYSEDKGQTWITLIDTYGWSYIKKTQEAAIGSGQVYGNEVAAGWLGGLAVNYTDPNYLYGCSMSSAKSNDGGSTFIEYTWPNRNKSLQADGGYWPVSASRHNADNHTMVSTPSGRIFRGSDSGILEIDPNINGREWTNIGGDIGSALMYKARANEYGDQTFIANTQDNDNQTYRYGRWGNWRGYEGSTVALNPMSNEPYFSGGGGGTTEGTDWSNSWNSALAKADVVTGNWYLLREKSGSIGSATEGYADFGVVSDIGRSVHPVKTNTANTSMQNTDFCLCRDTAIGSSLFVLRSDGKIVRFDNESSTYTIVPCTYNASCIAVNPNNVNEIYIGVGSSGIYQTTNGGVSWTNITNNIPAGITWNNIYYHEGSGDIYAVSNSYGIFLKSAESATWQQWMKGYNPAAFGGAQICYATQEMMIFDYGRGLWLADLEHPADRFFKQGFKIKQLSNINGIRTFGIDSKWDIPLYHNYQWYVNGVAQTGTQFRTLTSSDIKPNDKVQLKLTLREAPDVQTTSSLLTVGSDVTKTVTFTSGRAIKSEATGRMDLGHKDFFDKDFTVEMWVNPVSTDQSVLIGNRKSESRDQQGWLIGLFSGALKFIYAPRSNFYQPTYETSITQEATLSAGALTTNKWSHIAVTVQRNGLIKMYVNGVLKNSSTRIIPEAGLNSVQPLSLLGDGYDYNPANASVDELRIWKRALSMEEIRAKMWAQPKTVDKDLVYYNDFNALSTDQQKENFSQTGMRSRTRAVVSYPENTIALCANQAKYDTITSTAEVISSATEKIVSIRLLTAKTSPVTVSRFDGVYTASTIPGMSPDHFDVAPYTYKIDAFGSLTSTDSVEVRFYIPNASNYNGESVYMASNDKSLAVWTEKTKVKYDAADGTLVARFAPTDLVDKLITIVKSQPGIALAFASASNQLVVPVYRENASIPFTASLLKSMPAPTGSYTLSTSRAFAQAGALNFGSNTTASSTLTVNTDTLGDYGDTTALTINGMDNRMIPYRMTLQQKIAPKSQGYSLRFIDGGATAAASNSFSGLNNTNTLSMMGWFRLDSLSNLTSRKGIILVNGSYGVQLSSGTLQCYWNGNPISTTPTLSLNSTNIGKWVHIAMTTKSDSVIIYLNGRKSVYKSAISLTKTSVGSVPYILLGRTSATENSFDGAMDQVTVWNRTLTEAEVIQNMHQRAYNDETGLVASVNMDARNDAGALTEMRSNQSLALGGALIEQNHRSTFPYNYEKQTSHTTGVSSSTDIAAVQMPASLSGKYYLTQYGHLPYNYVISGQSPVYKGFFTVDYMNAQAFGTTDSIAFVCRQPDIIAGDSMRLVIRTTGSEGAFAVKAKLKASANGLAGCKVKATDLPTSFEAMWVTNSSNLQTIQLSVDGVTNLNNVVLNDNQISIPVVVEKTSAHMGGKIDLVVTQSAYARFDNSEVDLSSTNRVIVPLIIDRTKINTMGFNDIQIGFIGATGSVLNMKFTLEPVVQLSLVNGSAADKITATDPTVTLNVEAKLIQGAVSDPIVLNTTSDMDKGLSVGTGYLSVTGNMQKKLDYTVSPLNPLYAGWNFISNPYLVSVLLNKEENRTLNNVSNFFYQFNPDGKNFEVFDARYFDNNAWIRSMEPFFIQAKSDNASLTINGVARKQKTDGGNLAQVQEIGLELWSSNIMFDRTAVRIDNAASAGAVQDEDAIKIFSFDTATPQIYTTTAADKLSINTIPTTVTEVPLAIKTTRAGTYTFKVIKASQDASTVVQFVDGTTVKTLSGTGDLYTFTLASGYGTNESRFKLRFTFANDVNTPKDAGVNVWSDRAVCHIDGLRTGTLITIYDASGKKVADEKAVEARWSKQLPAGVYMVNLNIDSREYKGKVIIK